MLNRSIDEYETKYKRSMKMGKLERFLELYPHWIGYIAAGVGLFTAVFNYQHGHIEELPTDLGITLVGGIMGNCCRENIKTSAKTRNCKREKRTIKRYYVYDYIVDGWFNNYIYILPNRNYLQLFSK